MPAGVTWGQYIAFSTVAMLSMLAGSQIVHQYYRPLKDLNEYIERELKNLPDNVKEKIKEDLKQDGVLK